MCSFTLIAPFSSFTHVSIYLSDVFDWLKSLPGFDAHVFTRGLLAGRKLGARFARNESFRATYSMFNDNIRDAQKLVDKSIPPHSIRPKLMATSGAPGSGKSFLLDELAAFLPADVDMFALPASRAYFDASNVLALNVTFNSDTPISANFDTSAEQSLSLRILFQYVPSSHVVFSCCCKFPFSCF